MSFVGKAIGSITGSNKQAQAATDAAQTQSDATKYASDLQQKQYEQTRADLSPYTQAGTNALSGLMGLTGLGGENTAQLLQQDPSYQFRLNQGLDAVQSGAGAQGSLMSGATQKALNNYAQDYASQEYGNVFNRLSSITGMGQNAAAQVGNAGMQTAQNIGNNAMSGANATAAGQIAAGNKTANNFQQMLGLGSMAAGLFI